MLIKDVSDNIYKRDADKFIGQPGKPQTVEQAEIVNTFVNNRDQYNPRDIPPQVTQSKIINKQYKNEFNLDLGKTSAGKKLEHMIFQIPVIYIKGLTKMPSFGTLLVYYK